LTSGIAPPEGNALTRGYQAAVVGPITKGISMMAEYDPVEAFQALTGRPVTNQWPHLPAPGTPEARTQSMETAKAIVPQDLAGGLATAASIAAGPAGPFVRVAAPMVAAGVGDLLSGKDLGASSETAALYGAAGLIPEVAGKAGSWLLRSVSNNPVLGGKANLEANYAKKIGDAIGKIVPEMGGATTADALAAASKLPRGVTLPPGFSQQPAWEQKLGEMLDVARTNIKGAISDQPLNLASWPGAAQNPAGATLLNAAGQPIRPVATGAVKTAPLDEALGMLSALYRRGYSGEVIRPEMAGLERGAAKQMAHDLKQEITAELIRLDPNPQQLARRLFQESQNKYAMGLEIIRDIAGSVKLGPRGTALDEGALQQTVFSRLNEVGQKLGRQRVAEEPPGDALKTYLGAVYNDAPGFGRSALGTGTGDIGDSLRRAYGQGQGGTPAGLAAPFKAILENAGARYFGQQPFATPPRVMQGIDLLAQRLMDQARQRGVTIQAPVTGLRSPFTPQP
jgi:hypothetical protein